MTEAHQRHLARAVAAAEGSEARGGAGNPLHHAASTSSTASTSSSVSSRGALTDHRHHRRGPSDAVDGKGAAGVEGVVAAVDSTRTATHQPRGQICHRSASPRTESAATQGHAKRQRRAGADGGGRTGGGHTRRPHREAGAAPPHSQLTLCCDGVTVRRRRGLVIDCVSALVYGGRLTAVVNCCGSHSAFYLLNALAGQEEADEGNILVNGTPVTAAAYQRRCVLLDEDFTAFEELTVKENLGYASAMRVAGSAKAYTVDDILRQLLLVSVQDDVVRDCSLYVRRRLSLGKELLRNPSVIILDQPLDGLATHEAQQFLSILQKVAAPAAADAAEDAAEASRTRQIQRQQQQQPQRHDSSLSVRATASGTAGVRDTPLLGSAHARGVEVDGDASTTSSTLPTTRATTTRTSLYTPRLISRAGGGGSRTVEPAALPNADGTVSVDMNYSRHRKTAATTTAAVDVSDSDEAVTTERVVILSMTQPRWALLRYVDDVLLLEESRCAYGGPLEELLTATLPPPPVPRRPAPPSCGNVGGNGANNDRETGTAAAVHDGHAAMDGAELPGKRPRHEAFVYNMYRLASTDNGGLCRALGPNSASAVPVGASSAFPSSGSGMSEGRRGNSDVEHNVTRVREAVDRHLQQCATGALALTGWQYSSPGGFVQLFYLFKYSALQIRNNILVDISLFVIMIAIAVLLAAIYDSQEGQSGMQNRVGIIFFLVSTTFLQSILSVESIRRDYLSFQRHRAHGYYPTWVFLTFRVTTCAVLRFAIASVFALAVFLTSNFGMPWTDYAPIFELAVIIAVTSFASYFTVFFTCTFMWSLRVDALVLFTTYTVNVVLAGLVLNLTTLPKLVQILSMATVVRLSYESCIVTTFWDRDFDCHDELKTTRRHGPPRFVDAQLTALHAKLASPLERAVSGASGGVTRALAGHATCYTGRQYAGFLGFDEARRWTNVAAMAGMSATLIVLAFLMMVLYRPRRSARAGL